VCGDLGNRPAEEDDDCSHHCSLPSRVDGTRDARCS
jgi:hypothetical protein